MIVKAEGPSGRAKIRSDDPKHALGLIQYLRSIGYNAWIEDTNANAVDEKALKMARPRLNPIAATRPRWSRRRRVLAVFRRGWISARRGGKNFLLLPRSFSLHSLRPQSLRVAPTGGPQSFFTPHWSRQPVS